MILGKITPDEVKGQLRFLKSAASGNHTKECSRVTRIKDRWWRNANVRMRVIESVGRALLQLGSLSGVVTGKGALMVSSACG
jgi:hypothetical protein